MQVKLNIPTSWNQLSKKQLAFVCKMFILQADHDTIRIRLFLFLSGLKQIPFRTILKRAGGKGEIPHVFRLGKKQFVISADQMRSCLKWIDFLFTTNTLTENKFPVIRIFLKRLYGPSANCYNITFREFIHASKHCFHFAKHRDSQSLNKLCAVLYRKRNANSNRPDDKRAPFDEYLYAKQSKKWMFVPLWLRTAIFIFFNAANDALMQKFPNVFPKTTSSSEPKNPVPGLIDSVKLLAGFDPTKDETILDMQLWQAMAYLETIIKNMPKKK